MSETISGVFTQAQVLPDVASLIRATELLCCPDGHHKFRHCERSEAIQNPSAERLWIASLRSE